MTCNKNIYPTSFPPIAVRHVTSCNFGREYRIKIKIIVLRLVRTISSVYKDLCDLCKEKLV